jgi:hypothetical protein
LKLKVRKDEFEAAGLKEGVYFVKVVEDIDELRIVDKSDIPVRFYSENGRVFADVPDDIVQKNKLLDGEEIEIISPKDSGWKHIAMYII